MEFPERSNSTISELIPGGICVSPLFEQSTLEGEGQLQGDGQTAAHSFVQRPMKNIAFLNK